MIRTIVTGLACWLALPAPAESLLAARTIRAQSIIGPEDVVQVEAKVPGALIDASDAVGMEARVVLYAGRPIREADVGPPAIVERNRIVPLIYKSGGLTIVAEGRALDRGGVGDRLRVMNQSSRTTVTGVVADDGSVHVGAPNS